MQIKVVVFYLIIFFFNSIYIYPEEKENDIENSELLNLDEILKNEHTLKGEEFYSIGEYNEAIKQFEKAIEENEVRGEPEFFLGSIQEARRNYSKSIQYFMAAVKKPLDKEYKSASLWKLILYFKKMEDYSRVLEYIEMFEKMDESESSQLERLKEEAELKISPEKKMAKSMAINAATIEKEIFTNKNEFSDTEFWKEYSSSLNNIIYYYEQAVTLDETLFHLYWKIAYYYEKLNNIEKAEEIYKKILGKKPFAKAYYKLGVIAKKKGNFADAYHLLNEAEIKNKKKDIRYDYFLYLNLSQVLFAAQNYLASAEYAFKAYENKYYQKIKNESLMPVIIFCYSGKKNNNKNIWSLSDEMKNNCDFSKINIETKIKDSREKQLLYFMLGDLIRKEYEDSKSITKKDKTIDYFYKSIYRNHKLQNKSKEEIELIARDHYLSNWVLQDISSTAEFLYNEKEYRLLFNFTNNYYVFFESNDAYNTWHAESSFYSNEYELAIESFLLLTNRNLIQEHMLLSSYLNLNQWNSITNELNDFVMKNKNLENDLINIINEDLTFENYRMTEGFKNLLKK